MTVRNLFLTVKKLFKKLLILQIKENNWEL